MVPSPTPVRAGTQGEGVVNALLLSTKQPVGKSDSTPAQQTPNSQWWERGRQRMGTSGPILAPGDSWDPSTSFLELLSHRI